MGRPCRCCGLTSLGPDGCCCSPWRVDYNADEAEVNWRRGELEPEYCGANWRLSDWEPVDLDGGNLGGYVTISKSWRCGGCNITENYDTNESTRVNPPRQIGEGAVGHEWDYGHRFSAIKIFKLSAPAYVKAELMGDVERGLPNRDVHQLTIMKMDSPANVGGEAHASSSTSNTPTVFAVSHGGDAGDVMFGGRTCCANNVACGEDVFDGDYGDPTASGVDPRLFNIPVLHNDPPPVGVGSIIDYDGYNVNISRAGTWPERSPSVTREIGDVPLLYRDPEDSSSKLYMPESACRQPDAIPSFLGAQLGGGGPGGEIQWAVPHGQKWPTCIARAFGVTSELAQCSNTCESGSPDPVFIPTTHARGSAFSGFSQLPYYIDTGNIRPCWRTIFSTRAGSNSYAKDINEVLFPAQYGAEDVGHLRSPMISTGVHLSVRSDRCGTSCGKTTKSVTLDQVPFNYNGDGTIKYSTEQVKKLIDAGILTSEGKYPILLGAGCYMIAYHFDTPTYEAEYYKHPELYNKVNDAKAALVCAELPVKEAEDLVGSAELSYCWDLEIRGPQGPTGATVELNVTFSDGDSCRNTIENKIEEAKSNLDDVIDSSADAIAEAKAALEEAERILRETAAETPFPDGGNGSPITGAFNVEFRGVNSYADNACENLDSYENSIVAVRQATMFPDNYSKKLWHPKGGTSLIAGKQIVWRCLSEYSNSQAPIASPYFHAVDFNCPEPTGRITIPPYKHIHVVGSETAITGLDEVESWHCDKRPEVEKEPIWASGVTHIPYGSGSRGSPAFGPYAACYTSCLAEWSVPEWMGFYHLSPQSPSTQMPTLTPACIDHSKTEREDGRILDANGPPISTNACVKYCVDSFTPRQQINACSIAVSNPNAYPGQVYCPSPPERPDGGPVPYAQDPVSSHTTVLPGSIPLSPLCWKRFPWQGERGECPSDEIKVLFRRDTLGRIIDIETGEYVDPMDPRLNPDHCEEGDPEFFD